ncbi:Hypothetical predicted protein [Podarcis lilfordi]|uniref:Uncharacterized protein n=1 Tax=Podarcis lilfordi TaxID=74358 RepID=A0AA35K5D7_9SAUR|nr:Hypothetical predicted protein [Podarcis lilfordi]
MRKIHSRVPHVDEGLNQLLSSTYNRFFNKCSTMNSFFSLSVFLSLILLLADPGFSTITNEKHCYQAKGQCKPRECDWPSSYYGGMCHMYTIVCCLPTK